jgi:hypothetical protein
MRLREDWFTQFVGWFDVATRLDYIHEQKRVVGQFDEKQYLSG